ncbi:DnaJ-like protein subfamily B member 14 [Nymphaea thermarum]|nr:DnaJ-like protein subfamily B member 14 [Nymphaea thermarum]
MECNKDEALRAREIAEKKMESKDYTGAHKLILKAKQLFPDLENVSQMLSVCSVHCSAETKVHGAEMDWYGILQVEPTADEAAIKKQYRKLALLLHPDKNKFAGAESAFKLIGEAMRILCDQAKRVVYDMKRNHAMTSTRPGLPRKPSHTRSSVRKQTGFPKDSMNHTVPQYASMNRQQQPPPSNPAATFWTMCPFCSIRYQYYRTIVNKALKCQNCMKPFIAHEVNITGAGFGTGMGMNQSFYPQKNDATTQGVGFGSHRVPPQGVFGTTHMSFHGNVSGSMPSKNTNEVKDSEIKGAQTRNHFDAEKVDELKKTGFMENQRTGSKTGKKQRKVESESSEDESADDEESEEINLKEQFCAEEHAGVSSHHPRRSSRNRKHVCYNENESEDDDTVSSPPSKRVRTSGASEGNCKSEMDLDHGEKSSDEESNGTASKAKDSKSATGIFREETKTNSKLEENNMKENGCEIDKKGTKENPYESDADSEDSTKERIFICPDTEFHDFDADKTGSRFSPDQVWAVYDDVHGLPRFYAIIKKVISSNFKVRITWLEPSPTCEVEQAWFDAELPVACGRFSLGKTMISDEHPMFSHLMTCETSRSKEIKIYPRKGEIWALYKHWDINWSSDPENHKEPEYEMVEILIDYSDDTGGDVIRLVKVGKSGSLFKRMLNKGSQILFHIPGGQAYRFSHQVPAYKMRGDEAEDVPKDSFELDSAAYPSNFKDSVPSESLDEGENRETFSDGHTVNSSDHVSTRGKKVSVSGLHKPKASSPLKDMKYEEKGKDVRVNDNVKSSTQVPGDANGLLHKKPEQVGTSKQPIDERAKTNSNGVPKSPECSPRVYVRNSVNASKSGVKFSPASDSKQPKATSPSAESPGRANSRRRLVNDAGNEHAVSGSKKLPGTEFHDFQDDRSIDKFRVNQIWAAYDSIGGVPRLYARIKRVDSSAKKIYLTCLQICSDKMSEDEQLWLDKDLPISCGVFSSKNVDSFGPEKFSHQVRDDPSWKRGKYGIYPRQGEVWATYISWSSGWSKLDFERHKCSVVEVVVGYDAGKGIAVCHLVKVKGHQTVFKQGRRKVEIKQLLEFSHRIPAFQLTNEVGGELNRCWELDPASVPPELFA